ncbi:hypothetical protein GCM10007853_08040 [Algimonas ampicilliniresistens]|uniref:Uncharacterized protein n=1 Tax=Algimonas ampicilliniresistens TaxID=1298735 RepID=A0ABQ5V775_9PROT|nr:hypothetical protein [Algimonas ampicilliniresistens]GLQ22930.1 hypothetical protein GCM10007853_08040 [Algimonas ampicilliniresistens]
MKLPTYNFRDARLAYLSAARLKRLLPERIKTPFVYHCDNGLGAMFVTPVPGGVSLEYILSDKNGEHSIFTGLQWAKGSRPAFDCPRCERPARRMFIHPYGCAVCFKLDRRIREAILAAAIKPETPERRAFRLRHSLMSQDELDAEIAATMDALTNGTPDNETKH